MSPSATPLPAERCPLCGEPNACAPAQAGDFQVACWCTRTRFPASLLARIPAGQRGLACICNACVDAALAAEAAVDTAAPAGAPPAPVPPPGSADSAD
ncbi:hypothetical protein C7444_109119 [Sphaerotilus hippei]|uniref:Cysteine-rich CWC n=1 Tax=Sphaerotilus hippei TaxID=744406 RepID=A0A318GZA7_9BURK|nr:cysteine-rich CWC family protein [Sphaerotilus hippei]PXW95549.1 hypothetical protein C7444_109119 [Sphaerotilus hippei]